MKIVKKGDTIKVEYTGTLEDGTVFDSTTQHNTSLEFEVGSGKLLRCFEEAVVGMQVGEEKVITLAPNDAYGAPRSDLIREVPKEYFPADQEVRSGMFFMMGLQDGREVPIRIAGVSEDKVTIDLNHPLAGKTLIFKVKVIDIVE